MPAYISNMKPSKNAYLTFIDRLLSINYLKPTAYLMYHLVEH